VHAAVNGQHLYKVAATAFDCIRGTSPAYFKHVCTPASDISGRAHLHSAECRDMLVPRTRTELGWRSFPVAATTVWNSLPAHLRSTLIGRKQFRDGLKSHLFAVAYFWSSENIRYKSVMYVLTYLLTYDWLPTAQRDCDHPGVAICFTVCTLSQTRGYRFVHVSSIPCHTRRCCSCVSCW